MKLFFETSGQYNFFLAALPVGFVLALCLDSRSAHPIWRFAADLLVLGAAAGALLMLMITSHDGSLRLYHLLGLFAGALLYMEGFGRIRGRIRKRKKQRQAGKAMAAGESIQ